MSFAGTPLGQGRRLDRGTFLNKQSLLANNHPEPNRLIPASYSYSATTLGPRSPPKSTEPSRDANTQEETDESALVRFARAKQREQATLSPQASTSNVTQQTPVDPRRWTVKDTSVNIASAFAQAALDMNPSNNDSWHSATSQPPRYSRASSVEFEQQRMQAPTNRRLADPSTRFNRKPVSKADSRHSIPDSEGEEDHRPARNERGKSPFNNMIDSAKRVLGPAAYYLQQRSQPTHDPTFPPREPSYDYAQEEEQFQNQSMRAQSQRKNRIPDENKAYQPSEDEFSDEDDVDEGRGRKRKGKKRDSVVGGPLSTLPVMKQDKARRRKRRNGTGELEDDSFSRSEDQILDQQSQSFERASLPPRGSAPPSRAGSVQPEVNGVDHDSTFDVERALSTVPEADEEQTQERVAAAQQRRRSRSASRGPSSRPASLIGGPLGYLVNWAVRTLRALLLHTFQIFTSLLYLFGGVTGTIYNTVIRRPATWVSGSGAGLVKILLLTLLLSSAYLLREPIMEYLPKSSRSPPIYQAPDRPAANVAEFSDRLLKIEAILSELSHDAERARIRVDTESRSRELIAGRLGSLEGKVQAESKKAADAESQLRALTKADIRNLQRDVEALQVQLQQQQKQSPPPPIVTGPTWDEERLRALEERVGTLDAGVKEALDLGKKAATHEPQTGTPWWSKITPGSSHKSDIVIKTTDGQDISKLLSDMVDSAVSLYGKDNIGKADYALYSAGGRVIPSLTSDTMEDRPKSFTKQVLGFFTGADYPIGRPPVVALHHDVHTGYCWPFTGSKGQLGVVLALPVRVSEITVEHVASEVAFDMRTAPRDMEVWGLVEGQDNIEKVNEWQAEKRRIRREAEERGEEVEEELPYPITLPKTPEYVRIANFTYDINAPKSIQTFPVSQEIRDLDLDFGIVVLLINNNWGREYTCLYRMRVHGDQLEAPEPSEGDSS